MVKGLNGIVGTALAITDSTPRTGAGARPFQQDTSVIRDRDIASGAASACGKTKQSGAFDMVAMTDAVAERNGGQLPSIRAGEELVMSKSFPGSEPLRGSGFSWDFRCASDQPGWGWAVSLRYRA